MEIEVIEQDKTRIKFALHGAGHTFCNHLKAELYNDANVDAAAYKIDHPLLGTPTFIVQKKSAGTFPKILADAVARVKKDNKAFKAAFAKI